MASLAETFVDVYINLCAHESVFAGEVGLEKPDTGNNFARISMFTRLLQLDFKYTYLQGEFRRHPRKWKLKVGTAKM